MFTGIIETVGIARETIASGTNRIFWIESAISQELKVDQSVSHNGVCLTVEEIKGNQFRVTAIAETLAKTNLQSCESGTLVNLERCLRLDGRLDGHFVQGHVDTTGLCISKRDKAGSWEFDIEYPPAFAELMIEKGSICLDGISLTAFNITASSFTVAIIPFTYEHTSIRTLKLGDQVNLEFDIVGKYIARKLSLSGAFSANVSS